MRPTVGLYMREGFLLGTSTGDTMPERNAVAADLAAPPVPTDVERLARLMAGVVGQSWERLSTSHQTGYVAKAQELYDLGVRCPEQTED